MRKHFLILMLLALLPLAGLAQTFVRVVPSNVSKYYGQADAVVALTYEVQVTGGGDLSAKNAAILRAGLQIQRNGSNAGEALGDYNYTMTFKKAKATTAAASTDVFNADDVDAFVADYTVGVNGNGVLSIERMPLSEEDVAVTHIPAQIHTGSALTPPLTVKNTANDETLVEGKDYEVEYTNNIAATEGVESAVATLTGIGNYEGTTIANFAINAGMNEASISAPGVSDVTYNGDIHVPTLITVKVGEGDDETILTKDTHYTLSWSNSNVTFVDPANPTEDEIELAQTHAGVVTMTFTGIDAEGYTGTTTYEYTIKQKAVTAADVEVALGDAPVYSGSALKPAIAIDGVTATGEVVPETDYVVTTESVNAGDATATLTFNNKSNFTLGNGVKNIEYVIAKKELAWDGVGAIVATLEQEEGAALNHYTWTNANIKPVVTLVNGTKTIPASNYTITYVNVVNEEPAEYTTDAGEKYAVVTANADGNYAFEDHNLPYTIDQKALTITVKNFTVGYASEIVPELEFSEGYIAETPNDITKPAIIEAAEFAYSQGEPVDDIDAAEPGEYTVTISNKEALRVLAETNAANYAITFVDGTLTKTAGQVFVQISNNTAEYGGAFPEEGWTVSYVSGLSDAEQVVDEDFDPAEDEPTTTMEQIIKTVYDNPAFALVTPVALLDVNPEGYAVKYGANGVIPNPNYVVTAQNGKLIVGKKHILAENIQIEHNTPIKYSGSVESRHVDVSPSGEFPGHEEENDYLPTNYYETVFDENVNAGEHRIARLSMKGLGTEKYVAETPVYYTDEDFDAYVEAHGEEPSWEVGDLKEMLPYVEKEYEIVPLEITITANDFIGDAAWTYGSPEGNYTATVSDTEEDSGDAAVEAAKLAALLAGEQPEGFNGKLVVKRVGADNVGTYNEGLMPMIVDAEGNVLSPDAFNENNAATNYNITFKGGKLEVVPGTITVKAKDVEIPYGEVPAELYLEVVSGMENDATDFEEIATYSHDPAAFGYDAENFKARGTYTLNYKNDAPAPTATNYNVVFADDATGTLEVTKRPVKIEVFSDEIEYAGLADWKAGFAADNEAKNFGDYLVILDEAGFYGLTDENELSDVIASVDLLSENVGTNVTTATAATTAAAENYAFTFVTGTLTITGEGVLDIVLNRVAKASYDDEHANTAAQVIAANDGKFVNVKFSDFSMIAEKWYPLVLPFATSVKDISNVFGYAVVDVFNGTTADGKIKFKLHMGNIEANTPFIVKVYENQNMADATFETVKIVKAYDANKEVKVNEGSDVDFVGTYLGRIDGFRSNMYYFSTAADDNEYHKGNDTNKTYLRPLGAYFVDNAANAANMLREILIEEADGSTTAISAITVDGAFVEADGWYTTNGVKLQGAPTEKGVYIRNGKKIVIK